LKNIKFHNIYLRGLLLIGLIITPSIFVSELILEESFSIKIANGWKGVERWKNSKSALLQELYSSSGRGNQRVTFFGGDTRPH
jgi:hypothetical protein